jgi:hypothetical protein
MDNIRRERNLLLRGLLVLFHTLGGCLFIPRKRWWSFWLWYFSSLVDFAPHGHSYISTVQFEKLAGLGSIFCGRRSRSFVYHHFLGVAMSHHQSGVPIFDDLWRRSTVEHAHKSPGAKVQLLP